MAVLAVEQPTAPLTQQKAFRTLALQPAAIEIIALLMRQHPSLAPRLAPAGPSPNEPFADENVAGVTAVDAHGRERAAIAVRALAQDLEPLTLQ